MNCIYQGRVTKAETLNSRNADPAAMDDWLSGIGHSPQAPQHHALFQDAVNHDLMALRHSGCALTCRE